MMTLLDLALAVTATKINGTSDAPGSRDGKGIYSHRLLQGISVPRSNKLSIRCHYLLLLYSKSLAI